MSNSNKKTLIKRSVIRQFLSEMLTFDDSPMFDPLALPQAGPMPKAPPRDDYNPTGPTTTPPTAVYELPYEDAPLEADPEIEQDLPPPVEDEDYVPSDNEELAKSLSLISKFVPAEKIEQFYNKIRELVPGWDIPIKLEGATTMNKEEQKLRQHIRKIIKEAYEEDEYGEHSSYDDYVDPDASADEQERWDQEERDREKARAEADKEKLKGMAVELGAAGPSGVRRLQGVAMKRLTFIANMPEEVKDNMHKHATSDYIVTLNKTGELDAEDVKLMRDNPDIVQGLDGYREFLHKYIRREAKNVGVDLAIHSGEPLDMNAMAELAQQTREAYGSSR